jgi:hypothetical protein
MTKTVAKVMPTTSVTDAVGTLSYRGLTACLR